MARNHLKQETIDAYNLLSGLKRMEISYEVAFVFLYT